MEKLLTGFLPKGKGTYIAIAIGLAVIWGSFFAVKFGLVPESTADSLGQQACFAGANSMEDADAKAAALEVCADFIAKPLSAIACAMASIALLVAAFLRRSITDLLNKLSPSAANPNAPATGPPKTS